MRVPAAFKLRLETSPYVDAKVIISVFPNVLILADAFRKITTLSMVPNY